MTEVKAKKSVAKQVTKSATNEQCLVCGNSVGTGPRGLCSAHYQKFYREMMSLSKSERIEFEQEQIREGRILAALQINSIKRPNPFPRSDAS